MNLTYSTLGVTRATRAPLHGAVSLPHLPEGRGRAFAKVLTSVAIPPGYPYLSKLLNGMTIALTTYVQALHRPSPRAEEIRQLLPELRMCAGEAARPIPSSGLGRMGEYPAARVLTNFESYDWNDELLTIVGAELSLALVAGRPFSAALARRLLQAFADRTPHLDRSLVRAGIRARAKADRIFEASIDRNGEATILGGVPDFSQQARWSYRNLVEYAREKTHQGAADYTATTPAATSEVASVLKGRVAADDPAAMAIVISSLIALEANLALQIPLLAQRDGIPLAIDVNRGLLFADYSLFASGQAMPARGTETLFEASSQEIVTPIPLFLHGALIRCAEKNPGARNLGELIGLIHIPKNVQLSAFESALPPTPARFRKGLPLFALSLGIDRLSVAIAFHAPGIVPTGKFFYCATTREEVWTASAKVFQALGWGEPTMFEPGPAMGSAVVATDTTVARWHSWMRDCVVAAYPGKNATIADVVDFHAVFCRYTASLLVFFLGLRERNPLPLDSSAFAESIATINVLDKASTKRTKPRPVPVCKEAQVVLRNWTVHCGALDRRLASLGCSSRNPLRRHLSALVANDSPHLLFLPSSLGKGVLPVGTSDITMWWPKELALPGNFSRHYWQNRLRAKGLSSAEIDAFMRHSAAGIGFESSTGLQSIASWTKRVVAAMDSQLSSLGMAAVPGLTDRSAP